MMDSETATEPQWATVGIAVGIAVLVAVLWSAAFTVYRYHRLEIESLQYALWLEQAKSSLYHWRHVCSNSGSTEGHCAHIDDWSDWLKHYDATISEPPNKRAWN